MEKRITQIYFQIVFCGTGRTKYQIDSVPKYILDQPELHKKKSFKIGIPKNLAKVVNNDILDCRRIVLSYE